MALPLPAESKRSLNLVGGTAVPASSVLAEGGRVVGSVEAARQKGRSRRVIVGRHSRARRDAAAQTFSKFKMLQILGVNKEDLSRGGMYSSAGGSDGEAQVSRARELAQKYHSLSLRFRDPAQEAPFEVHRTDELRESLVWDKHMLLLVVVGLACAEAASRIAEPSDEGLADVIALVQCLGAVCLAAVWVFCLERFSSRRAGWIRDAAIALLSVTSAIGAHVNCCHADGNWWMSARVYCASSGYEVGALVHAVVNSLMLPWMGRLSWPLASGTLVVNCALLVTEESVEEPLMWHLIVAHSLVAYVLYSTARERRQNFLFLELLEDQSDNATRQLAFICHEIRNPLSAIIGNAEMLADSPLDPEQAELVSDLYSSCQQLHGVVNDILDLTKIGYNKMAIEDTPFDPYRLARTAVAQIRTRAAQGDLKLSYTIDAGDVPPLLRGDPARLLQCCANYLGNAVKFTPRNGSIGLHVGLEERLNSNRCVLRFSVTDTGEGIAPEDMDRLFQSFSQTSVSIARRHGGTGLGLTIVKELAELMHGDVGVTSTPGVGSTFWFTAELRSATTEDMEVVATSPGGEQVVTFDARQGSRTPYAETAATPGDGAASDRGALSDTARSSVKSGGELWAESPSARMPGRPTSPLDAIGLSKSPSHVQVPTPGGGMGHGIRMRLPSVTSEGETKSHELRVRTSDATDDSTHEGIFMSGTLHTPVGRMLPSAARGDGKRAMSSSTPSSAAHGRGPLPPQLPKLHVLVVDDESTLRKFLAHALKKAGLSVHQAADGAEALEMVKKAHALAQAAAAPGASDADVLASRKYRRFDVVTMDIQMAPGVCGTDATTMIRDWERDVRCVPCDIIAVTSNVDAPDRIEYARVGMDAVVQKPVDITTLLSTMAGLLRRRHILVVDDQKVNARTVSRMLRLAGHLPVEAHSGEAAVAEACKAADAGAPFELLLLDLNLAPGGITGAQALEQIRARGVTTPAVVVSGDSEMRTGALELGFAAFLKKPVERALLLACVAEEAVPRRAILREARSVGSPTSLHSGSSAATSVPSAATVTAP